MKIRVATVKEGGTPFHYSLAGDWFREQFAVNDRQELVLISADVSGEIQRTGDNVLVRGEVEAGLQAGCCRCLEPALLSIRQPFQYVFLPGKEETSEERELTADELEAGFYEGEEIDLNPLVFEQIVLQVPMKILCREDCRGLCPRCGSNLNEQDCSCIVDRTDARFAQLKEFKTGKHS